MTNLSTEHDNRQYCLTMLKLHIPDIHWRFLDTGIWSGIWSLEKVAVFAINYDSVETDLNATDAKHICFEFSGDAFTAQKHNNIDEVISAIKKFRKENPDAIRIVRQILVGG